MLSLLEFAQLVLERANSFRCTFDSIPVAINNRQSYAYLKAFKSWEFRPDQWRKDFAPIDSLLLPTLIVDIVISNFSQFDCLERVVGREKAQFVGEVLKGENADMVEFGREFDCLNVAKGWCMGRIEYSLYCRI